MYSKMIPKVSQKCPKSIPEIVLKKVSQKYQKVSKKYSKVFQKYSKGNPPKKINSGKSETPLKKEEHSFKKNWDLKTQ